MNRAAAIVIFPCIAVALPRPAFAYRPFDSTDAAVAEKGDLELELGPLGFLKTDAGRFLVAPSAIFNLGIARDWELVLQGRHFILLDGMAGDSRFRLIDTGLFLKGVLREGSLQEVHGPSVAIEVGPLLPTINGEPGIGATATLIVSQHWKPVTLHVNGEVTLTRAGNLDLFGGAILEGPREWAVRPVVEAFVEREFGAAFVLSGLVGAIWQLKEGLSLDIALRAARVDTNTALEVRAGLTWATSLWRSQ
ncbi:MAG: hypothetical protein E6J65_05805 [Deltaproteobacteria bacterium]|nr:MAG: hypothetical protein E6J65_05805 [Deltaproteobacteria bacterium]